MGAEWRLTVSEPQTNVQLLRAAAVAAVAAALLAVGAARAAAAPGPDLTEPRDARLEALRCFGNPATSPGTPVLLIHGTGVDSEENWKVGYRPALLRRGHAVCTVDLPDYGYVDVQRSVEYVVTAIRTMSDRAGRPISILGHSQGAFQPIFALRVWPDLHRLIEDFIGLSGAYDRGSEALSGQCSEGEGCVPALQQVRRGSSFLRHLGRKRLPGGPSYTAIGTLADEVVTPQPQANELPRGREVEIQDVCPGRRMPAGYDHVLMAGDAVAFRLVLDALGHPGPADPARIDRSVCGRLFYDDVDLATFATILPTIATRTGDPVRVEPELRCYMKAACRDPDARGRMLTAFDAQLGHRRARLRFRVQAAGELRVRAGRHAVRRRFGPGPGRLRLAVPVGARRIVVETRPTGFTTWAREAAVAVRR